VGRERELAHVAAAAISGDSKGLVLAGPPGVGKTRLAAECLAEVERAGLRTVRVAATRAAAALPFGALAPLLPAIDGGSSDRADFLRRCCAALQERAAGQRLVLLVDDAHLLDDASAVLVHQMAITGTCFVLATLRTGELVPESVVALWKDGHLTRLDVAGLGPEAIEQLVGAVLDGPVGRATVAHLAARSQGNVLFLRELVIGARTAGALSRDGGAWHLTGPLSPTDRLVELVEGRLGRLDDDERALLELVALGEPLGAAELEAVADPRLAESLERQGLLQSRLDGRRLMLGLTHPIYGDVVRARVPAVRLRTVHQRLAGAVESTGARRREDALRVGTWGLDAGAAVRPDLMFRGAVTARIRWDLPLAERLARVAHETGAGFEAGLLVGQVQWLQGHSEDAEATLAALGGAVTIDAERAMLATVRMDNLVLGLNRADEAVRVGEEAESAVADPSFRDEIVARRAYALIMSGQTGASVELIEPLLPRAERRTLAAVALSAAHGFALAGRTNAALEATRRGLAAHRALAGIPLTIGAHGHVAMQCLALTMAGRLLEAEELARAEHDRSIAVRSVGAQALFAWFLSRTLLERGRPAGAAALSREAAGFYRRMGWPVMLAGQLMYLGHACALRGELDEARAGLDELDGLGLSRYVWGCEAPRARAWVEVAAGSVVAAVQYLEEAAAVARESGELTGEVAALHDLVRLGQAEPVAARLAELTKHVDGDLAAVCADHAQALAGHDAAALEAVAARFETIGADLCGAEAAAQAGVAWRQAGDSRRATAAERRAATLAGRCEGAVTPALSAVGSRVALTTGERDVALLAAAGRTNPEIAAQLHLSRRTVENYLYRVYEKLGISTRDELASALER
jgi:DNA-binding CsgD family transcriptional regulator